MTRCADCPCPEDLVCCAESGLHSWACSWAKNGDEQRRAVVGRSRLLASQPPVVRPAPVPAPVAPVAYPSLLVQAANAAKALGRAGGALLSGHKVYLGMVEQDRRLRICHGCEFFDHKAKRCGKCGCFARFKNWLATEDCPIHKWDLPGRRIEEYRLLMADDLVRHTLDFARALPPDLDAVVGVARSGLVPASLIASYWHLPLWTVSRVGGVTDPGHGFRMGADFQPFDPKAVRRVLVVDDSAATGKEMPASAALVAAHFPAATVTKAVIYCHPDAAGLVDLWYGIYPGAHYLEWNFFNAGHSQESAWDFDGCLCMDQAADGSTLGKEPIPLYVPRRNPIPLIVSGRAEDSRAHSMAWLAKFGARVDRMVLRDWELDDTRDHADQIGAWKANEFGRSNCTMFIESDPRQAEIIARATHRRVLCPQLKRVLMYPN